MKKTLKLLILCLLTPLCASAQNSELNTLADIVASLKGGEKAYNQAVATLAKDKLWTPMDELTVAAGVECRASDRVPGFRLNSALTNAENKNRYQTTTANHLNGADSRFNYSLIEKTLKAGKSASYSLHQRWGEQTFLIIPYAGKSAGISATAAADGHPFTATQLANGVIRLTGNAVKDKPLTISIKNASAQNASYVIINYNSRK